MLSLDKHRHASGSGQLYYIDCTLENPLALEQLSQWDIDDVIPHMQLFKMIISNDNVLQAKHIVVKLRNEKETSEHTPQKEFLISEKLKNINGFIHNIGVFENICDDGLNKHILVMPYIHCGSLMEFQMTSDTIPILKSLLVQATLSLAEAFIKHGFIHQSLHWCNVLYEKTDDIELSYEIGSQTITIFTHGYRVIITDLSQCVFRDTEPYEFWRLLERFYNDHWQIFVGYLPRKIWNNRNININEKTQISKEALLQIIEQIYKSSFYYDTDYMPL
jgi:hypothetical protein